MQIFNLVVLALAGVTVAAKDPNAAKCREMSRLEHLEKLAGDDTKLKHRFKNNSTKIADFKKKAADDKSKLADLKKDANLVKTCEQRKAVRHSTFQCYRMMGMQRFEKMVNNQTTLDRITQNDQKRKDELKKKVEANKDKLNKLQSNSTLTQFCSVVHTKNQCRRMEHLTKKVDRDQKMVNDKNALDSRFNKDTIRINLFKARAARDQEVLNQMKGNKTLTDACNVITQKKGTAASTTKPNDKKSAAAAAQAMGISATLLAVAVAGFMSL